MLPGSSDTLRFTRVESRNVTDSLFQVILRNGLRWEGEERKGVVLAWNIGWETNWGIFLISVG